MLASSSRSTVLVAFPKRSDKNCLVVLKVFILHSLMVSILFWADRLIDLGTKSPLGLLPALPAEVGCWPLFERGTLLVAVKE